MTEAQLAGLSSETLNSVVEFTTRQAEKESVETLAIKK